MSLRVAILRGEALNPFELQSYAGLSRACNVVAIGARDGRHPLDELGTRAILLHPFAQSRLHARLLGDRARRLHGLAEVLDGFDVVHAAETFIPISEQAAELRARAGFKLVLTCWETIPFLHEERPEIAARKRVVREAADLFLPVTEAARSALQLENVPAGRIQVQPVGVNRRVFRPLEKDGRLLHEWNVPPEAPVILYSGRLVREKGVLCLLLALEHVPGAVLVVAGDGPEKPRLEAAAAARGIAHRVRFIGARRYSEMPGIYACADVFCLPSLPTPYWEEQFGMVLVEAMACGVPIVASASGAIAEVVGDAALLVPAFEVDELAAALRSLVADPVTCQALVSAGLRRAAERYDAGAVAAALERKYEQLFVAAA